MTTVLRHPGGIKFWTGELLIFFRNLKRSQQQGNSMTIGKPFQKGQSGNPGGRPKEIAEVKELARQHMPAAIDALVSIMNNPEASDAGRVSAANALLDRGCGKPPQHITGESVPASDQDRQKLQGQIERDRSRGLLLEAKKPAARLGRVLINSYNR